MRSLISTGNTFRHRLQLGPRPLPLSRSTQYFTQRRTSTLSMGIKTDITLYTAATPNGIKIPILLEELGLEYKVRRRALLLRFAGGVKMTRKRLAMLTLLTSCITLKFETMSKSSHGTSRSIPMAVSPPLQIPGRTGSRFAYLKAVPSWSTSPSGTTRKTKSHIRRIRQSTGK